MSKVQLDVSAGKAHEIVERLEPKCMAISKILKARLHGKAKDKLWDISIAGGCISDISPHSPEHPPLDSVALRSKGVLDAAGGLVTPSLCHAHVHLDKCFLLHDDKYSDLQIVKGDFSEAMSLTSEAKQRFEEEDLVRRGMRLVDESSKAGVTVMRAFVEVDEIAELKCVNAGLKMKKQVMDSCHVQICAFAQLALFSGDDGGEKRRSLMGEALDLEGVDVIGSTPYVEDDLEKMKRNVQWTIRQALARQKHLDFHLDYNIDPDTEPLVWYVIEELKRQDWKKNATHGQVICLGHCTRLTLLNPDEWERLHIEIDDLPVAFVGLPTSDIFMMGRPKDSAEGGGQRPRATLQIPDMINRYGLQGAISINNVGNAFTPYGTCDPLSLASLGVGIYQAGTKHDTELLYETVTSRAAEAIGRSHPDLALNIRQSTNAPGTAHPPANLVIFSGSESAYHSPRSIAEAVYAGGPHLPRQALHEGYLVNRAEYGS